MILSERNKKYIKEHALENPSQECCGLLYTNESSEIQIKKCNNIAENSKDFFTLDPKDYLKVSSMGKIIGCYHSHCNDNFEFTDFDKVNAENFNLFYVLFSIKFDGFKIYEPIGFELPYQNRQYVVGFIDCISLVRDYFLREKNVKISDLNHPYRFVEDKINHPENTKEYDILPKFFEENGFVKVNNLKKHDVILMKSWGISSPTHAGVYLGDNILLHHPFKRYSLREEYAKVYQRITTHVYRHQSLI